MPHLLPSLAALLALAVVASPGQAHAEGRAFDVEYGGRNLVRFTSSALLETIVGRSGQVRGTFSADPSRVTKGAAGRLELDLTTLVTGLERRDRDMAGPQYLHTEKFPLAVFSLKRIEAKRRDLTGGEPTQVTLHGTFELHGVSRDVTVPGRARYVPFTKEIAVLKKLGVTGDALHFTGSFDLKLTDYGIRRPQFLAFKIADVVRVDIDVFGFAKPR